MIPETLQICVRKAARALGRHGLAHAFGHVSVRIDDQSFLVCAPEPLGLIPAGTPGIVVNLEGELPEGVLGEVRIHREIYRRRPDVLGVTRSMPPKMMSLSTLRLTPLSRHGFGSYFHPYIPLWDDPLLVRDDKRAIELSEQLGKSSAIVMRGNGLVTTGASLEEAVVRAWFAEDAARVELDVLAAGRTGSPGLLNDEEAESRAVWSGQILERMWRYLTHGDPE